MAGEGTVSSGAVLPRTRLFTGLLLMLFTAGHLLNACLGLVSISAMEAGRAVLLVPWQTLLGQILLYGSLTVHMGLGLVSLARRVRLTPTRLDLAQLGAGIAIPVLLLAHIMATRIASLMASFRPDYAWILAVYWRYAPDYGLQQVLLVAVVWGHGCIGLFAWLRLRRWWPRVAAFVFPPVFALPIVALFGFVRGGDEALMRLDGDPDFGATILQQSRNAYTVLPTILTWQHGILGAYVAVAALALLPMTARRLRERFGRQPLATLHYVDGPAVDTPVGTTILDVSRRHAIPHAALCSGHARCGTCRVRVRAPDEALSPVARDEALRLAQLHLDPADIRLACRAVILKPVPVLVERLVPVEEAEAAIHGVPGEPPALASLP
jgi:adenylate cyclase